MAIPEEILKISRPKNTIVQAYGKDNNKYVVRQRSGYLYKNGKSIPINGSTIGHIINGVYVPINDNEPVRISMSSIEFKEWANIVLCNNLFSSILSELKQVYCEKDAITIYCISIIRVCNPGIKDYELKEAYLTSFLSEIFPDIALSKNTVSTFLSNLGKSCTRITEFMKNRTKNVKLDHHLLIDGTLKSNESEVNTFSDYSRKAKTKGTKDISVLFAFDLEEMEPICSKCFPGNMLDSISYEEFIVENGIEKGIIIGDKGFPFSSSKEYFDQHPFLYYLNPIKRNSKLINKYNLYDYTGILSGFDDITYKKEKCIDENKWLYSFRDANLASMEEKDWLKYTKKNGNYKLETLRKKQKQFGTVIFESNLETSPEVIYNAYKNRWEIDIVMRFYKSACEFDETRVHDDYSVMGTEFCDFLSTILTYRLINKFNKISLSQKYTYKSIMKILERKKKVKTEKNDWKLVKMNPSQIEILKNLELIEYTDIPKKKPGRPKKSIQ